VLEFIVVSNGLLYQSMAVSRRAVLRAFLATGVGAVTGVGSYGYFSERHELELTRANVPVAGLPASLVGLRIGLITDVHRSRWVSADDVTRAVSTVMREQPDLIVLGGDYVTWGSRLYVAPAADALRPLSAPHGVFAILGNHDDDHDMPAALAKNGVQVLKDAHTRIVIRGEPIDMVGVRFWTKRGRDIASISRGANGTIILLAHDPRRLAEAAALKIPLVLSGHTHGGQVVLPVAGAIAARKFSPPVPLMAGIGRRGDTTIFVSRGVGTIYVPVRINCPPEVAVLTLQREGSVINV
jgi:predicted MPP superfamily phosphohydrolase